MERDNMLDGLQSWVSARIAPLLEARAAPVSRDDVFEVYYNGASTSIVGVNVTAQTALGVPAIFGAINLLAGTLAAMPLSHVKISGDGDTFEKQAGPLNKMLGRAANPETSAFDAWFFTLCQLFTHGRGLMLIQRNGNGPQNLWTLETCWTTVLRRGGRKFYRYAPPGAKPVEYSGRDVIDLTFMLEDDGFSHVSPIYKNRDTVALMLAVQKYGAKHFNNGGIPPFIVTGGFESAGSLDRAAGDIDRALERASTEGRIAIALPKGLEVTALGKDMEASQMVTTRAFNVSEVSRIYDIPPIFLHELGKAAAVNVEHLGIQLVRRLTRWVEQIEGECTLKLFGRDSDDAVKFDMSGMLRGEFAARMEGLARAVSGGVMTPNEARAEQGLPSRPEGDKLFIQGATVPMEGHKGIGKLEGQENA